MSITPQDIAALDGPLARLAARATEEPKLIANGLCVYALHADMTLPELCDWLKLPVADFPRLFLCAWPEPDRSRSAPGRSEPTPAVTQPGCNWCWKPSCRWLPVGQAGATPK
jgi:hypothetical protein